MLPTKEPGAWTGTFAVHDHTQAQIGETAVRIEHEPLGLRRARHRVTWDGVLSRSYSFERYRDGARVQFDGPEVFGNATAYGRALFTSQHLVEADARGVEKIRGREVLLDAQDPETPARGGVAAVPRRHRSATCCTAC